MDLALQNSLKVSIVGWPSSSITLEVKADKQVQLPLADFILTPTTGTAPESISFNAMGSKSPDGQITSYSWNFGDGQTGSGLLIQHTYTKAGTFNVQLKVTDNFGGSATKTKSIVIKANQLPIAKIVSRSETDLGVLKIYFDGSTSTDADGTISKYDWSFGDNTSASGIKVDHTYTKSGTYTVTLKVTDNKGGVTSASQSISVVDKVAPRLTITAPAPNTQITTSTYTVSGTSNEKLLSITANGQAVTLAANQTSFSSSISVPRGSIGVSFIGKDLAGNSTTVAVPIVTKANVLPVADFTVSKAQGVAPLMVMFDASPSKDSDGQIVKYEWDFAGTKISGNPVTYEFASVGTVTVTLKVTDNDGGVSQKSASIVTTAPVLPPAPETVAPRLAETDPTSLGDSVEFLYSGTNPIQTGVQSGAIEKNRVAVLKGRVLKADGTPLDGVVVTVLGDSRLGQTKTRADGQFDIAVNGGVFSHGGLLS